jgi:hypothetical protein
VYNSEYPECSQKIENVEDDDEGVHLVLLKVVVSKVSKFDVSVSWNTIVVVIKKSFDVLVVCNLTILELKNEEEYDTKISSQRATLTIPIDFRVIILFLIFD